MPPVTRLLAVLALPGSAYPDHFFFGDPHINYYEGTAELDDAKLYLPDEG
ncbi:hypothetical protein [Sorangium sp. So ce1078]